MSQQEYCDLKFESEANDRAPLARIKVEKVQRKKTASVKIHRTARWVKREEARMRVKIEKKQEKECKREERLNREAEERLQKREKENEPEELREQPSQDADKGKQVVRRPQRLQLRTAVHPVRRSRASTPRSPGPRHSKFVPARQACKNCTDKGIECVYDPSKKRAKSCVYCQLRKQKCAGGVRFGGPEKKLRTNEGQDSERPLAEEFEHNNPDAEFKPEPVQQAEPHRLVRPEVRGAHHDQSVVGAGTDAEEQEVEPNSDAPLFARRHLAQIPEGDENEQDNLRDNDSALGETRENRQRDLVRETELRLVREQLREVREQVELLREENALLREENMQLRREWSTRDDMLADALEAIAGLAAALRRPLP